MDLGIKYTTARHIVNVYKQTGCTESLSAVRNRERKENRKRRELFVRFYSELDAESHLTLSAPM